VSDPPFAACAAHSFQRVVSRLGSRFVHVDDVIGFKVVLLDIFFDRISPNLQVS
jgi:hypothetical protein